jgi:hypothetical protein
LTRAGGSAPSFPMRRAGSLLLMLLVLVAQSGGLQVLAWTSMALRSGTGVSVVMAKPCSMCQAAQELDGAADDRSPLVKPVKKADLAEPPGELVLLPVPLVAVVPVYGDVIGVAQWFAVPEIPPPQRA